MAENEPSPTPGQVPAAPQSPVLFEKLVGLIACELLALPLCFAGVDALMEGKILKGASAVALGLFIGAVGVILPFRWKTLSASTRQFIQAHKISVAVIAFLFAFVTIVVPDMYARATARKPVPAAPVGLTISEARIDTLEASNNIKDEKIKELQAAVDKQTSEIEVLTRERDDLNRSLRDIQDKKKQRQTTAKSAPPPPQGTVNAPNGIGSIGGTLINPQVNNFGPPPAHLSYREEIVTPLQNNSEKVLKVHISTDRAITGAVVGIQFSAPITMTKEYWTAHGAELSNSGVSQLNIASPLKQNGIPVPNSLAVIVNIPAAFMPGQDLTITATSKEDVRVLQIGQVQM